MTRTADSRQKATSLRNPWELGKGEVRLDDYEVRSWHGWYVCYWG